MRNKKKMDRRGNNHNIPPERRLLLPIFTGPLPLLILVIESNFAPMMVLSLGSFLRFPRFVVWRLR